MNSPSFEIYDVHQHVGPASGLVASHGGWFLDDETALRDDVRQRLAYMDKFGIRHASVMPGNGFPTTYGIDGTRRVNNHVRRYQQVSPDRLVACYGTVNPLEGVEALKEIDRCIEELGMHAMMWHHRFLGVALDHPMMDEFVRRLQDHGKPAFIHTIADSTLESPWRLERLADRHPDATFVALDAFSSNDHAQWMPYIASRHPNILFDTGVMVSVGHLIEGFIEVAGPERLLFGSNYYSRPQLFNSPFPLTEFLNSSLSQEALESILGGNARRILGLSSP
ncbi:amidohydrolase family protein [Rhizobium sp. C4]|uniref:amidohydrolase family protein n=1 Tax=Rhizobium sp. C4 TaxID=1349800 RepID=UPI001E4AB497|nr:amidohydrolase family protein [Rhizobium sp. C4]MCD2176062.1 amidohydrolase family protein [Rhizobium sp. C4]